MSPASGDSAGAGVSHPTPSKPPAKHVKLAASLLISGVFVALAIWSLARRGVTLGGVWERLVGGAYGWILVYVAIAVVLQCLRIARWGVLLRGIAPVPWRRIVSVGAVGLAAIALLPVRLGEAVRPVLIAERRGLRVGEAAATVVVERVIDGLLVSLMFILTLYFLRGQDLPDAFLIGARATAAIFGTAAAGLVIAVIFHRRFEWLTEKLVTPWAPRLGHRLVGFVEHFFRALRTLSRRPGRGASFLGLTVVLWIINGCGLLPLFWSVGVNLSLVAAFAVLCVMVVGFMIPAGPAGTGTLNYAIVLALTAFGVDDSATGALAILIYVLLILTNLVVGLMGLAVGDIQLAAVRELTATAEAPAVDPADDDRTEATP